jgi:hypothetical protein
MGAVRVWITHTLDEGQMAVEKTGGKSLEGGVKAGFGVQRDGALVSDSDFRTGFDIFVIAEWNHGIQPIVASSQLKYDEYISVFSCNPLNQGAIRLGMKGVHSSAKKRGESPAERTSQKAGSQELSSGFKLRG